jgi:Toprim-like
MALRQFGVGFVDEPLPGHEQFRGWLAIPYLRYPFDREPTVVSIRFRCIMDHEHVGHGKYMTVAGDRPRMYNTRSLDLPGQTVGISEGEFDAMAASIAGLPTVGIPGATAWQSYFREPFLGYQSVFVFADGDDAGMGFAHMVAKSLPNAKVVPMPPGMDVNSLVQDEGPEALLRRVQ